MQQYSLLPENKHSLKQTWIALKGKKERVRFFHYMGSPFVPMFNHWDSRFAGVLSYANACLCDLPSGLSLRVEDCVSSEWSERVVRRRRIEANT
jgi:hypothetical protein